MAMCFKFARSLEVLRKSIPARSALRVTLIAFCVGEIFVGNAKDKAHPPPPSSSTILIRVDVTLRSDYQYRFLQAVNLETNAVSNWRLTRSRSKWRKHEPVGNIWVVAYATPGRYLITTYRESSVSGFARAEWHKDVRLEIAVPRSDVAIFYGTITIAQGVEIRQDAIDPSVRDFYDQFVPFKRSELIVGEIKPESR
jgi:hypothetical protein